MAAATLDALPTGTIWLVIGLVSGALLVTGVIHPAWVPAAAFTVSVLMFARTTGRRSRS